MISKTATTESKGGIITGGTGRVLGFLLDILLLALFLIVGVAILDVFVKLIVLIVGYVRHFAFEQQSFPLPWSDIYPGEESPQARHFEDWTAFGKTVGATIIAGILFVVGLRVRRFLLSKVIDVSFESFISKRYLLSREGGTLVNLITVVSVLGVSVGVTALVVVISVMNGFDRTIMDRLMGVFSHVEVWPVGTEYTDEFSEQDYLLIKEIAENTPGIEAVAPVVRRQTFLQGRTGIEERKHGGVLHGFDVKLEQDVTRWAHKDNIAAGTGSPGDGEVVLGDMLSVKLGAGLGDTIQALGKTVSTGRGPSVKILPLKVTGIFKTGLHDVDDNFAFTNLHTAQQLMLTEGRISYVHMKVDDPDKAPEIARALAQELPRGVAVRPWQNINPEFFEALQVEKVAMFIILLLIVLVASLNIVGTLVMVVTQKTREIGMLKSMGATRIMILRIFLFHGLFIGIVGTSLGTACGLWLCRFVKNDIDKIFQLPPAVYGLDRLPVVIDWSVIGFLAGSALLICILAGIIPAMRAARLNPVEALRYY